MTPTPFNGTGLPFHNKTVLAGTDEGPSRTPRNHTGSVQTARRLTWQTLCASNFQGDSLTISYQDDKDCMHRSALPNAYTGCRRPLHLMVRQSPYPGFRNLRCARIAHAAYRVTGLNRHRTSSLLPALSAVFPDQQPDAVTLSAVTHELHPKGKFWEQQTESTKIVDALSYRRQESPCPAYHAQQSGIRHSMPATAFQVSRQKNGGHDRQRNIGVLFHFWTFF